MFEVHKRHTPMFVTAEIKRISQLITHVLEFDDPVVREAGIEIAPIFQTARINENNQFIVTSKLSPEKLLQIIREEPHFKRLRAYQANPEALLESVVRKMVEQLGVDSYICVGRQKPMHGFDKTLSEATKDSQKPVVIFTTANELQYGFDEPRWNDVDHPAIWLEESLGSNMATTEAFFAISPTLKMDVGLNRHQPLESFGSFAVGMVRF